LIAEDAEKQDSEKQGTPSLTSQIVKDNQLETNLEIAKALSAEKEQMRSVIEEYSQKVEEIEHPPFKNEQ
jgi:hypothetical protein